MPSKASTVEDYLNELPDDKREVIESVRDFLKKKLDKKYQETMAYGMIGYSVPHDIYPDGYHCNPSQPLPFVSLGATKNHCSLSIMGIYASEDIQKEFVQTWEKSGKKLDMGKSCIRFKSIDDLALDAITIALKKLSVPKWIAIYEDAFKNSKSKRINSTQKSVRKKSARKKSTNK